MILMTVSKFKFNVMDAFHEILKADKKIRGACRSGADLTNLTFSKIYIYIHTHRHKYSTTLYINWGTWNKIYFIRQYLKSSLEH